MEVTSGLIEQTGFMVLSSLTQRIGVQALHSRLSTSISNLLRSSNCGEVQRMLGNKSKPRWSMRIARELSHGPKARRGALRRRTRKTRWRCGARAPTGGVTRHRSKRGTHRPAPTRQRTTSAISSTASSTVVPATSRRSWLRAPRRSCWPRTVQLLPARSRRCRCTSAGLAARRRSGAGIPQDGLLYCPPWPRPTTA